MGEESDEILTTSTWGSAAAHVGGAGVNGTVVISIGEGDRDKSTGVGGTGVEGIETEGTEIEGTGVEGSVPEVIGCDKCCRKALDDETSTADLSDIT